ncbi:MAG: extracytoplasmic binding receptor [Hyphomicrobiales bacterium]|nr:extracytoplasmic binding receptor [Hyphomicrobiales bacterium]
MNALQTIRTGLVSLAALCVAGAALAQSAYPNKPVKVISDSAPGSSNDVTIRVLAEQFSQMWGQQVVVVNHPGAGGALSARVASQAEGDGYTLYIPASSTFLALKGAPNVPPNLPIELPRDFLPIGLLMTQPMFIGVSKELGVSNVAELIALAKKRPGEISFAATGRGRITHLTMELFQDMTGVKLTFIPYTGGPAAAMNDVTSGRVGIVLDGFPGVGGAIEGNMIVGVANTAPTRLPGFEKMPVMAETVPGFRSQGWNAVLAPIGTPEAIIRKISADLHTAQKKQEVIDRYRQLGSFATSTTPEELIAFARSEQEMWRPTLEKLAKQDAAAQEKK